jgi:RNA polymerase sigma-70 factor (ECF subfamily)
LPATLSPAVRDARKPGTLTQCGGADELPAEDCLAAAGRVNVRGVGGTDAWLVARLAAGDDHALAEVFDRLGPAVYGAARRVLGDSSAAQDVAQDVFVELWSRPRRYDPAAGALRTYLTVLARRRAVDVLRSELRRAARQERHHRLSPGQDQPSPCQAVLTAEAVGVVRDAVQLLPGDQRRVIELAYFEGLSYREVALAAGIPEGTAKSRLRLALAKLEATLDRQLLEQS